MASMESQRQLARHRADEREARLLFCLAYPFCLVLAVAARMSPARQRSSALVVARRPSVFREAKTSAGSFIPFAFR